MSEPRITEPSRAEWKLIRTDEKGTTEFEILEMNLSGLHGHLYGNIEVRIRWEGES